MLRLKEIVKKYVTGDTTVTALKGVSLDFRPNEFVSVLGPSGCGKTTLLNIIGGLDRYDSGELFIKGRPTSSFKSKDWDSYRNHSIGFVFQSYNLIPHQSVLSNVELALTLSGVSKAERRAKAIAALEKVGLGDQLRKKPNQMSGGQMQRVAIARALVNDPEIILADEPTGALDSATSLQIMEILKSISKEKLIIMVTHNPELAEQYSTRIIRLSDGQVIGDSNPYNSENGESVSESKEEPSPAPESPKKSKKQKTSMSFLTALSLSLNNLLTKKGRTFLTSFAGSIGIIGIALILSLSNGINLFIERVQQDTLSSYPISIAAQSIDYTAMMTSMMGLSTNAQNHGLDAVYTNTIMTDMINVMMSEVKTNNLADFKKYLDSNKTLFSEDELINDIQYGYNLNLNIYDPDTENGITKLGMDIFYRLMYGSNAGSQPGMQGGMNMQVFTEMIDNEELLESQYDILGNGRMPKSYDEIVLVINENNEIADMALYALGLKDQDELVKLMEATMKGEVYEIQPVTLSYDEIYNTTFKLVLPSDYYEKSADGKTWVDVSNNESAMKRIIDNGITLKIVGILRPAENAVSSSINSPIGYTHALTEYIINQTNRSAVIEAQKNAPDTDILTGLPFPNEDNTSERTDEEKAELFRAYAQGLSALERADLYRNAVVNEKIVSYMIRKGSVEEKRAMLVQAYSAGGDPAAAATQVAAMSDEEVAAALDSILTMLIPSAISGYEQALGSMTTDMMASAFDALFAKADTEGLSILYDSFMQTDLSRSTYEQNLATFGMLDLNDPSTINIYPTSFSAKEKLSDMIEEYNADAKDQDKITYTDYVALMMSSVTTIINFVSYALIAFVSISLIVSSIMIGIITYISVLERTKEIGILRAIGASKKDISRVFNAETFIVGLAAGLIGILVSLLLCIPINIVIKALADVANIAVLPVGGGVILVVISVVLTLIAGLIPSRLAANKDPVIALRTE